MAIFAHPILRYLEVKEQQRFGRRVYSKDRWVGIDPTNNSIVNGNHVRLCAGRDFRDCSPVKGVYRVNSYDNLVVTVKINDHNNFDENKMEEFPNKKISSLTTNSYDENHQLILLQHQQYQQLTIYPQLKRISIEVIHKKNKKSKVKNRCFGINP